MKFLPGWEPLFYELAFFKTVMVTILASDFSSTN